MGAWRSGEQKKVKTIRFIHYCIIRFIHYFRKCPLCNNSVRVVCSNMGASKEIKRISQMMTTKSSEEGEKYKVDNIAIESI